MDTPSAAQKTRLPLKIVVVGCMDVGKTTMLNNFIRPALVNDLPPAYAAGYTHDMDVDGVSFRITFVEISPRNEARLLEYVEANAAIFCFSCASPDTFSAISYTFIPELLKVSPNAGKLLVCNKKELRNDEAAVAETEARNNRTPVRTVEGETFAQGNDMRYFETCATSEEGLKTVFEEAVRIGYQSWLNESEKKSKCNIL